MKNFLIKNIKKLCVRNSFVPILIISIVAVFIPLNSFATVDFNSEIDVSNDTTESLSAKFSVVGSNVYVVWQDDSSGEKEIFFKQSSDDGASFGPVTNLSNTIGVDSTGPQILASGSNVFVVWKEGSSGDILFRTSSDDGINFSSAISLSNNVGNSDLPQLATSGSNVYVVWQDNTDGDYDIYFAKSTDLGNSFGSIVNLSSLQTSISENPQISAVDTNVYVVWGDDTGGSFGNSDVFFIRSIDSGVNFDTAINLSSNFNNSVFPQLSVLGANVFVVWDDQTTGSRDIYFRKSENEGAVFDTLVNLSNNTGASEKPQIAVSGTSIHVVWKDSTPSSSGDILFKTSDDTGVNFGNEINLSENSGTSDTPLISSSGSDLYVIWRDDSFASGLSDVLLRSSSDDGATFVNLLDVGGSNGTSIPLQVYSSGTNAFVLFQNNGTGNNDIFFRKGITASISLSFDSSQYRINDTPVVTLNDLSLINSISGETISVDLTSNADQIGITLDLVENLDTGVFSGSFAFVLDDSAPGSLKVAPGNIISATFGSTTGSASIFPDSLIFDYTGVDLGTITHITVSDQNANIDPLLVESVQVNVFSDADPVGITLTLYETDVDTGIFTGNSVLGNSDTDLIFMLGDDLFSIFDEVVITSVDFDYNVNPNTIDFLPVTITSNTSLAVEGNGIVLNLVETGANTTEFSATLKFSSTASDESSGVILASDGDILSISDPSAEYISNAMIIPNDDPSNGAIRTFLPGNVTVTYHTLSSVITVLDQGQSGGGGGGLVRPGLVANVLYGFGGGGTDSSAPTLSLNNLIHSGLDFPPEVEQMILNHNSLTPISPMKLDTFENFDFPLIINNQGFVLGGFSNIIQTQNIPVETPVQIKLLFYETTKLQHISLYTNLRDDKSQIHQSDTQILYNDGKPLKIVDPNGLFSSATVTINDIDDVKKQAVFDIVFAKPMETSDMIIRSWDPTLHSTDTFILDALNIVSETVESPLKTYEEPQIEQLVSQSIPIWVKNNAGWWSDNQISDEDFISGIQYMVDNDIISISSKTVNTTAKEIPDWIQNNAGWWSENKITDNDFVEAMKWLITNGVIIVQ